MDVLVETSLASSKREAREFVESGSVMLGGEKLNRVDSVDDFEDVAILKRGKKNLVVLVS